MAGIFPTNGVASTAAPNAIDADTTCAGDELFYAFSRCFPRFDTGSMNAIISEILNAVNGSGLTYDCDRLDNLSQAINGTGAIQEATVGGDILDGYLIESSDGNVFWNNTGGTVAPADITDAGLLGDGFTPMNGFAVVAPVAAATVDSFGNPVAIGDPLVTFVDGQTLGVTAAVTVTNAVAVGVDSFGNVVAPGDQVIALSNGDTLVVRAGATVAIAAAVGVDSFGNPIAVGDEVITFANGDTLVGDLGAAVATATAAGVDSFGNIIANGDEVMTLTNGQTINLNGGHTAVSTAAAVGVDTFGTAIAIGDEVLSMSDGTTFNLSAGGGATVTTAAAVGVDTFGTAIAIGDEVLTTPDGTTFNLSAGAVAAVDASTTVKGVSEVATPNEIRDVTVTGAGGTSAPLVMTAEQMFAVAGRNTVQDVENDRVWVKEAISGQMRWLRLTETMSRSFLSSDGIPAGQIPIGSVYTDDAGTGSVFLRIDDGANDVWVQVSA